jgi:hypothetical protein
LKPPGGSHHHPAHLADNGSKAAIAKPLLHHRQYLFITAAFGIDDPVGWKAGLGKAWSKEIGTGERPKHNARASGGNARCKQGRGRIVAEVRPGTGYFVKRCSGEAAAFKPPVDCIEPERQALPSRSRTHGFDRPHLCTQGGKSLGS